MTYYYFLIHKFKLKAVYFIISIDLFNFIDFESILANIKFNLKLTFISDPFLDL